jgi:hypothetical protein
MSMDSDLKKVAERFTELGWSAQLEPKIGDRVPDMLLEDPKGQSYIVQTKGQWTPVHMADLGQITDFRDAFMKERRKAGPFEPIERIAEPKLVFWTKEETPTGYFKSAADALGIDTFSSKKRGDDLVEDFVTRLTG